MLLNQSEYVVSRYQGWLLHLDVHFGSGVIQVFVHLSMLISDGATTWRKLGADRVEGAVHGN